MPLSDEFEALELIGRGSFGNIRKVRRISDGKVLVRKEISYKSMNQKEKAQLIAEFRILKCLDHPNIVQYLHHEHNSESHMVYLYMEYCGGGDLAGLIRQCKETMTIIPEHFIWSVFTQLILALYRCHFNTDPPSSSGELFSNEPDMSPSNPATVILHRDIKPDNVFMMNNDGEDYSIKLGDFGLAKMLDEEHLLANTYVGTPYYMSPEVLMDQPSTPQSDIWSLGCVIYELCALHPPFQAKSHLLLSQKIREGVYSPIPDYYSSTLSKTISACLNLAPLQRPTTATLLRLDVIKLCRKEQDLIQYQKVLVSAEEQLARQEAILNEREKQLQRDYELHKIELQQQEQEMVNRLERELSTAIDVEVQRRVEAILNEQRLKERHVGDNNVSDIEKCSTNSIGDISLLADKSNALQQQQQQPPSPSDISMESLYSPLIGRMKGPRTVRDNIISPLRANRPPFKDLSNNKTALSEQLPESESYSSESTTNTAAATRTSLDATTTTSGTSFSATANWQTSRDTSRSTSPQRASLHYNIGGQGLGAASAKARLNLAKGASLGKAISQIQKEKEGRHVVWDENIHGENMPSPFLKRWERGRRNWDLGG